MFAKLAKIAAIGARPAASGPSRLAHSNDNRPDPRVGAAALRTQRPMLVCRWQPAPGGRRLECRWSIELVEAAPAEEPQPGSTISPAHVTDSPQEADNGHHLWDQVRPRSCAPLWCTRSLFGSRVPFCAVPSIFTNGA
jgi:hypothetical protein